MLIACDAVLERYKQCGFRVAKTTQILLKHFPGCLATLSNEENLFVYISLHSISIATFATGQIIPCYVV